MSRLVAAFVLAVPCLAVSAFAQAEDAPKAKGAAKSERTASIEEKLSLPAEVQYLDTQIGDVVQDLQLRYKLPIALDSGSTLEIEGLGRETPVTLTAKNMRLESLLNHLLLPRGFDWMIRDELLLITTKAAAEANEDLRVYPVADLAARKGFKYESVMGVIVNAFSPLTWRENGGTSANVVSVPERQAIVVTVPSRQHRQIARLLEVLRELKPDTAPSDSVGIPLALEGNIRQELLEQTEFEYLDTQLTDIAADLETRHRISILIDKPALTAEGRDEVILSSILKNLSLASALNHMLRSRELAWVVADEALVITTRTSATSPDRLQVRIYPIGDLVTVDPTAKEPDELAQFRNVIEESVTLEQWETNGGFAGYESFPSGKAIVIRHTEEGHRRVATLLAGLRSVKAGTDSGDSGRK